ncbi:MAG TPA: aspartate racemase [Microscillaceae bacterium]|nr:aspartate racemase [Microscillaceae bacterium]
MKKIGLIGGISWASTQDYYRLINEGVNQKLGGLQAAECIIYSLNFGELQQIGWKNAFELLLGAAENLKKSGVEALAFCANTAHLFAPDIQAKLGLPVIHIVTSTAEKIIQQGITKVGLLGTIFTMEMDFYREKLAEKGIQALIPESQQTREHMQSIIKGELGKGLINPDSKQMFIKISNNLIEKGAQGLIFGCTEIPLLLSQDDFSIPVFDTTKIHSQAIVEYIVS